MTPPRAFTDDDLKRLKESPFADCEWVLDYDKMQSLLARLEAAEAVVEHNECGTDPCPIYEKWRKVSGK